jgi:hypothetical protein
VKSNKNKVAVNSSVHQHVVHTIDLPEGYAIQPGPNTSDTCAMSEVRLAIRKPGTRWGTSLWRVEVWGYPAN